MPGLKITGKQKQLSSQSNGQSYKGYKGRDILYFLSPKGHFINHKNDNEITEPLNMFCSHQCSLVWTRERSTIYCSLPGHPGKITILLIPPLKFSAPEELSIKYNSDARYSYCTKLCSMLWAHKSKALHCDCYCIKYVLLYVSIVTKPNYI